MLPVRLRAIPGRLLAWYDTSMVPGADTDERVDAIRTIPFILLHVACMGAILTGVSWVAVMVCLGLYAVRMFAITAVYHRLLAHRAYAAPRWLVGLGAAVAASAAQRGPLWWAAHHRLHHRQSDRPGDVHSPRQGGFWRAHLLWFMTPAAFRTRVELVPDLAGRPELRWLDRYDAGAPALLAIACFALGATLQRCAPGLGTSGWQMLVWGFAISTVLVAHATFTVNSLCHAWGSRPYATRDASRNNVLIALLTLGEGWHNNHHRYPLAARQGFRWWQLDPTWWVLRAMQATGLIHGLREVPAAIRREARP